MFESLPLNSTGVIDEEAGEIPRAFVVLRPDQELTASDITALTRQSSHMYKHSLGGVRRRNPQVSIRQYSSQITSRLLTKGSK